MVLRFIVQRKLFHTHHQIVHFFGILLRIVIAQWEYHSLGVQHSRIVTVCLIAPQKILQIRIEIVEQVACVCW